MAVATARRARAHVLEWPAPLVDLVDVQEHLDDVLLLRVAVPDLGGNAAVGLRVRAP
jgi:hypothetical protein